MKYDKLNDLKLRFLSLVKSNPFIYLSVSIFILLSLAGISGSSMAAMDQIMTGKTPGVVLGHPQGIRSDEWLVDTQETLIQKVDGYPENNQKIGLGQNMSIIIDVPFKSFFGLLKPQNLFFFILPFANAFAAKWWFLSLALVLGFYMLFTQLYPNKKLIAAISSIILLFNPFTQWWYQSITLLTIADGLWAAYFFIRLFDNKISTRKIILFAVGLAYSALAFIFCLYPPYQIAVAYAVLSVLVGFILNRYIGNKQKFSKDIPAWTAFVSALVATIIITLIFYITHGQIISEVMHTAYPGMRDVLSGTPSISANILQTLSAPILINLQFAAKAAHFYTNQSEASRIIPINLALMPVIGYFLIKKGWKKWKLGHYILLTTSVIELLFLIRMFTPLLNLPFKIMLLFEVPNERLAIGILLICVVQLFVLGAENFGKLSKVSTTLIALFAFGIFLDSSKIIADQSPGFISLKIVVLLCLVVGVSVWLMLDKKLFVWGLALFMLLNFASSIYINPLYDRTQAVSLEKITNIIRNRYSGNKYWIVIGSTILENIPLVAGQHSYSGVNVYPQLKQWHILDPKGNYEYTYNRYAHVTFSTQNPNQLTFFNPQGDTLNVEFNCEIAKTLPNVGYILSSQSLNTSVYSCIRYEQTVKYPDMNLYIYKHI